MRKTRITRRCWSGSRIITESSDHTYGSRRIKKALNILSYLVSRNKAQNLMREASVSVKQRKKYKEPCPI
ncbi:MAG: IS3 family transposase [Candidatus Thiodiazotropha sp. (ex Lucinoma aequizonata)]|nr:IS3 family transposase [Candidatus Thiodiazotropha sp. (ex Lucinoma aequizonata)]MCU7889862.1 IS3 family transposase [Candidatus Thiodiazotropha sp. (ex Lucinoma aequizonata)]MCU7894025.1 IS3 family transposase [Candidatus Thiodiazotropha sp. (ex Lucinoma aequizonata)]MCU7902459.1 IS3 family transposase [Candidatus Thiodiazotropha sp. (ex Lucinoma aequizonata)]MCU7908009.1 IS3 family transposase [Candidatus Thiodiazotropha sp. (ex Lucinoma aequizonata)]